MEDFNRLVYDAKNCIGCSKNVSVCLTHIDMPVKCKQYDVNWDTQVGRYNAWTMSPWRL